MPLDRKFLKYPKRQYGMDHDRYEWSMLTDRKTVTWPDDKKLAFWINVCLQYYPLNQKGEPFVTSGVNNAIPRSPSLQLERVW